MFDIPKDLTRIQATSYVADAYLTNPDRSELLKRAAVRLAEEAVFRIAKDCVRSTASHKGFAGHELAIDAYVLTLPQLNELVKNAIAYGEKQAMRFKP